MKSMTKTKLTGNPSKVRRGIASQYGMEAVTPIPAAKKSGQMKSPKVSLNKGNVKVPVMKNNFVMNRKYN